MITTERMIQEPTPVDGDARFQVAGRLLALAQVVIHNKADGPEEDRNSSVLRVLGEKIALHGIEYGEGWLEGWWYVTGTRDHSTWMAAKQILRDPSFDPESPLREEVRRRLLEMTEA